MAENTTNVAQAIMHDQISYVRETETRYTSSEGDTLAEKQNEDEGKEEDVAAMAVTLVVSGARQGVVTLCAKVAQILREKQRLEQKVTQLEQQLLQQQLHGSRRTSEEQSKTYSDRFSFSSQCSGICPYCSGERCGSCPPTLLPQTGLSASISDPHHPGLREEVSCAACGVSRRRSAQCTVVSADLEIEASSRTQNSSLNSEGKRKSVTYLRNERKELAQDWTNGFKARHEVQTQGRIMRGSIYASSRSLDPQLLINRSRRKFIRSRSICIHRASRRSTTGKEACGKVLSAKISAEQDGQGKPASVEEACSRVPAVKIFATEEGGDTSCGTRPKRPTNRSLSCSITLSTDTGISSQESTLCSLDSAYLSQDSATYENYNTHHSHNGTQNRCDSTQYSLNGAKSMHDANQFSDGINHHSIDSTRHIHDSTQLSLDSASDSALHSYDSIQSSQDGSVNSVLHCVNSSIEKCDSNGNMLSETLDSGKCGNSKDLDFPVHSAVPSCTEKGHLDESQPRGDRVPLQSDHDDFSQDVSHSNLPLTDKSKSNLEVLEAPYPLAACRCPICQQLSSDQVFVITAEGEEILKEGSLVLIEGNHIAIVQYMGHDTLSITKNQEIPLSGPIGVHVELWPPDNRNLFIPLDDIICQLEPDDLDDLEYAALRMTEESQAEGLQKGKKGFSSMQEITLPSVDAPTEMTVMSESIRKESLSVEMSAARSCIWESYV